MQKVQFVGESNRASDNPSITSERLVNLYPERAPVGARSPYVLRSVLGYGIEHADLDNKIVRAAKAIDGSIFVAASGSIFEIEGNGTVTNRGAITDDDQTTIEANGALVTIAAGGDYYVLDGASLTTPGSGAFTSEGSVGYADQYTLISEQSGRRVEWTDLGDPKTREALSVKIKEGRSDNVLRVISTQGQVWVMGEESMEIWYNTGQANEAAFQRVPGAVIDYGLKAPVLAIEYKSRLFYVGADNAVYAATGTEPVAISNPALEKAISEDTPSHMFFYEDRAHQFVCIRFEDRPAWCYDLRERLWHERSTGVDGGPWEVVQAVFAFGRWHGVTDLGSVRRLARTNQDGTNPLLRTATSRPLYINGDQFTVSSLEFLGQPGLTGIDRNVKMMVRPSWDGGVTFRDERFAPGGAIGEYSTRSRLVSFGRGRHFAVRVAMSDPLEWPMESDAVVEVA